jgi:HEAT repeat protein
MKTARRKLLLALFAGAFLLAGIFALSHYFSEPRHGGQRLTFWLKEYYGHHTPRSEEALLAIGTNAIPTLLKMLLEEQPLSLSRLLEKTRLPIELVQDNSPLMERRPLATIGFQVLGSNAASAIPALLPLLDNSPRSHLASEALFFIGEPALAPVRSYLASTNNYAKRHAVHLVLSITHYARTNIESLLSSPDPVIRSETYMYLRGPGVSNDYILDQLIKGLRDPDPNAASYAAIALRIGNEGTNALLRLYEIQNTTNTLARAELATTIKSLEKRIRLSALPLPKSPTASP